MKVRTLLAAIIGVLLCGCGSGPRSISRVDERGLGSLPPRPILSWELDRVEAEIIVRHLVPPKVWHARMPPGLRPLTLGASVSGAGVGPEDQDKFAALLAQRPELADHAIACLGFCRLDALRTGAKKLGPARPAVIAFWWVIATNTELPDKRARDEQCVELGFWVPDENAAAELRPHWPAAVSKVEVTRDGPTDWNARLQLPDGDIRVTCRPRGAPMPLEYKLPAYSTVWLMDRFTLYTYAGHVSTPAEGKPSSSGTHPLAHSLSSTPSSVLTVEMQTGWHARAGTYQRE